MRLYHYFMMGAFCPSDLCSGLLLGWDGGGFGTFVLFPIVTEIKNMGTKTKLSYWTQIEVIFNFVHMLMNKEYSRKVLRYHKEVVRSSISNMNSPYNGKIYRIQIQTMESITTNHLCMYYA